MFSVIIRNFNEGEYIGFAIQSVLDFIPCAEIILIDNNSTDDSINTALMFKDRIEIKILNIEKYTPGKAINLGVKNCKHKNILVLSGHSQIKLLNSDSVIKGLEKYPAIFGKQIPIYKGKKITPRYIWSHFKDEKIIENMFSEIEQRYFLHNAFCFYNRQFLINNPFDENLSGKEDRYWAANIVKKGFKYLYDSKNLICNHYYTTNGATWKGLG